MDREEFYRYINQGLEAMGLDERAEDDPDKWEEHYVDFSDFPPEILDRSVRQIMEIYKRGVNPDNN
tara:strand:+ start:273 stop:470 length:198 start_codon:yes stop_codon:yes gene_type:complete